MKVFPIVVSPARLLVGVVGTLFIVGVWLGVVPGPEAPVVKASSVSASPVVTSVRSSRVSLADCTYSIIQTGDFAEPGCAGWVEDDKRLVPAFQVLEILQADNGYEFQR